MVNATPAMVAVLVAELIPALTFGVAADRLAGVIARWPVALRVAMPALLVVPYAALAVSQHMFRWEWFALYSILPVAMAWLMERAASLGLGWWVIGLRFWALGSGKFAIAPVESMESKPNAGTGNLTPKT